MILNIRNQKDLPFCSQEALRSYCNHLNNVRGERGKRYLDIVDIFRQAIQSASEIGHFLQISENFFLLKSKIPKKIKYRHVLSSELGSLENQISERCYYYFTPLLTIFQIKVRGTFNLATLGKLRATIRRIQCSPHFRQNPVVEKCHRLCHNKFGLVKFANTHDISLEPGLYYADESRTRKKSIYPILSLDGGGIRGIIPLKILEEIESVAGDSIADLFKLIGGTSTGGMIGLGLSVSIPAGSCNSQRTSLLDIYTQHHESIFQKNPYYSARKPEDLNIRQKIQWSLNHSKYISPSKLFMDIFGEKTLSSARTNLLITTNTAEACISKGASILGSIVYDAFAVGMTVATKRPHSFISHDSVYRNIHYFTKQGLQSVSYNFAGIENASFFKPPPIYSFDTRDFPMYFAAQATSAAPTFFPLVKLDDSILMDGGILQNNPALPCVFESLHQGHRKEDLFMLSLGTGSAPHDYGSSPVSLWFDIVQPQPKIDSALQTILSEGAYQRLQYTFDELPELDDTCPETMTLLHDAGNALVEENRDALRDICKLLKPDCI